MSSKNVIVIGGGLAGLAAGVALAEAGCHVRLFEQRPFLGGRATSYVLPDGEHVDNCQHVTFGCCTNLEDFYRRVGCAQKIKFFDRLLLLDPQGRTGHFQAGLLPAPLHILGSFLSFKPLSFADKFSIARAMMDILLHKGKPSDLRQGQEISMLQWLKRRRQTKGAIDRFYRPVLVSALSEELDNIDARYGVDVFWKTVLSNRTGYRMGIPTIQLADLYEGCHAAIKSKGGEVTLRAPVRVLRIENGSLAGVIFGGGREETADAYIIAVPHSVCDELLPEDVKRSDTVLSKLSNLKDSSITGVHLWFDRIVMTEPFITLLDTTTQWVFNKTALYGAAHGTGAAASSGQYLQLVISASHDLLQKPRQEIIDLCMKEVLHALPAARRAKLVKATVIKEAAATFSPEPGCDRWRPKQETRVRGLFLAGDWTATGWPATMEGAVRSGYLAAEAVLRAAGTPQQFLQPDLKPDGVVGLFC
jgi:squalene-associated FAD-dependent desaturase